MNNNLQHCNMDIIVEELSTYKDIAILILGAHECSYFVHKFSNINSNIYSYLLTDKELSIGDYSELIESIKDLEETGIKVVIISTCVSQMINIRGDIEFALGERTVFINGSEFKAQKDIIQYLYKQLCLKENIQIKNRKSILKNEYTRFSNLCDDMFCSQLVCTDSKYRQICEYLNEEFSVQVKYATD